MSYLLDTNIISELVKRRKNAGVLDWFAATRSVDHYLSVLTVGELLRGVHRLRNRGDHRQADVLERAMTELRAEFAERIVPVAPDVAQEWALQPLSRSIPVVDALIGATARARGWTLVTRNTKDFDHVGVRLLNPFTS
ncbi:MAG: type II toxin-antitoxin system VapC family toxin [Pseudonocardia sp.]